MSAGEDAHQVDGEHPLPLAGIGVDEEAELVHAGVVDQDREGPVLGHELGRGLGCGDVQPGGGGADLAGDAPRALLVDVADHDVGALGGKPRRDRGTDAAPSSGDQRPAPLEPHRRRSINGRGSGPLPLARCARRLPRP